MTRAVRLSAARAHAKRNLERYHRTRQLKNRFKAKCAELKFALSLALKELKRGA